MGSRAPGSSMLPLKLLPHCMILAILFDYFPESLSFIHVQSLNVF